MRDILRKTKIQARNNLTQSERDAFSTQIVERILASDTFQKAQTIMIYSAVKGEVNLRDLEETALKMGKRLAYPLCITKREMIALSPKKTISEGEHAWKSGSFGIMEPIREYSTQIAPEELDMIICPCTVFDEQCGRMGMGAGYYDRFLEKCQDAFICAVAFEIQKADEIPMEEWDKRMDAVFTEKAVYYPTQSLSNCSFKLQNI